ncbi:MAG: transcriptional regulator NrdR [Eubacteriales bacterium]|jgi:transcriptional repressor NrdR|nr:transcriptional regulator NrdR [Lachnospiraceae bacterium]MDD5860646.1 transcriptional regulator NrdR [Eubacteriales bacterium]MCH4064442.1 transcriptional regulator NrdR [Lachnospiraceae bacterium]MCH4102833.1 transcriptional regulator NrdR [Lachnospiraceae bacterium]MCI1308684.1 transcriptional regulator NrdR [Lachnospiraceae bacterium]
MKCPYCGNPDTSVVDSRPADDNTAIRRRRVCSRCGRRFTSYERIETIPLMVIKKDHNREAFDRSKIEAGVVRACHKRPIPAQRIHDMVDQIENEIYNKGEREIPSSEIGEIVMKYMKDLDQVAYVRFASVYREFKDAETFMDELKKLLK